jgi:predicted enzyme related to lactoylglutathione lyase
MSDEHTQPAIGRTLPAECLDPEVGEGQPEFLGIRAVMLFSADPEASCRWWAGVLGLAVHSEGLFYWLDTAGGVELAFHPADDDKNPFGISTVPYWHVDDVDSALGRLEAAGARRHRGPLRIGAERRIAQIVDPFGVAMGVDGP